MNPTTRHKKSRVKKKGGEEKKDRNTKNAKNIIKDNSR